MGQDGSSLTFARMLKLLKLGKIFRMLRALRFLRELRVMVQSLVGSCASMFWSFVMMALILYLFALVFISQLGTFLAAETATDADAVDVDSVRKYFGTVLRSMLTLYMATCGGLNWIEIYRVLELSGPFLPCFFLLFILFWTFAIMNILGGIFLEKTLANSQPDREVLALQKRRKDQDDVEALRLLFASLDYDGDGCMTKAEFDEHLRTDEVAGFFAQLEVDIKDAEMFFNLLLSETGTDHVLADDFIDNCSKLRGTATSFDVALISYDVKLLRREINQLTEAMLHDEPCPPSNGSVLRALGRGQAKLARDHHQANGHPLKSGH